jgi:hypothetical protein
MTAFAVVMTDRDFAEGIAYLSDDFHEASGMGRAVLVGNPGTYLRARIRRMNLTRREAAGFWARQGDTDGRRNIACPLVPKTFVATYRRHFNAVRKEAAQG